jgi:hypothetical protein
MPTYHISDPEYWRDRAEEMRTLAEGIKDEASRQRLLRTAAEYDQVAERAAERARRGKQP